VAAARFVKPIPVCRFLIYDPKCPHVTVTASHSQDFSEIRWRGHWIEQRAWVGDSVVHQMVHLATNADWRLAWYYLTLSNSPRPDGIMPMSVVRSWSGGDGEYVAEKMAKTFQGIYEPDWNVKTEIVIVQPFMSYVVHDAVAQAGLAERLPQLFQRWAQFFEGGYDTIGECWGWGTHVHGWGCAPARDLMFYVLGVTPAEPGYTVVRIAPRLGSITHAEATVPTPHGLVHLEISPERLRIESPVPVQLVLDGQAARRLSAGVHEVVLG